jgi:hypothetical protein
MSASAKAMTRQIVAPVTPFAQGYCDGTEGTYAAHNRVDYAQSLYPRDPAARLQYLDGWLMAMNEVRS